MLTVCCFHFVYEGVGTAETCKAHRGECPAACCIAESASINSRTVSRLSDVIESFFGGVLVESCDFPGFH